MCNFTTQFMRTEQETTEKRPSERKLQILIHFTILTNTQLLYPSVKVSIHQP